MESGRFRGGNGMLWAWNREVSVWLAELSRITVRT